ncbi:MAG: hypothetical protein G01um101429_255 [Parcubacteria group bacterium Gr01-1014_29]|nr:MAG: hypothetical protein G01um101429_255 [Parcubacteria group bacterium Gr01-1014_29]
MKQLLPFALVKREYVKTGTAFGDAVSYIYMGKCVGFDELFEKWKKWEAEYAKRGYRTIPLDDFIAYGGGYVAKLEGIGVKRQVGEEAVLHAERYEQRYQGKEKTLVDTPNVMIMETDSLDKKKKIKTPMVSGTYELPTTK